MKNIFLLLFCMIVLANCTTDQKKIRPQFSPDNPLFKIHEPKETGIDVFNKIVETQEINAITHEAIYQGAGIGIINLNNDKYPDLLIIENDAPEQVFINNGDWTFTNVSKESGFTNDIGWSNGVAVVDIDGDGDDDIYVCKHLHDDPELRRNKLYINDGNGKFEERSKEFNLDDSGFSVMANFFDYDRDGDLDVYVLNQPPNHINEKNKYKQNPVIEYKYTNRLFRNDGQKFTDVSSESGLVNFNYSLSSLVLDVNKDGFLDIYLANDYEEPDQLYLNLGNGTFVDRSQQAMRHMSTFSMGSDVGDINNDGNPDIYVVDMVANDNYRQKTNMSGMDPEKFWRLVDNGYHFQYMFNALQLNTGRGYFADIAQLSNVSNTDWSWAALFSDMDLDGYADILVTNGIFKEVRNKDINKIRDKFIEENKKLVKNDTEYEIDLLAASEKYISKKLQNFTFKNTGDLDFEDKSVNWGFSKETQTQGAAYADFDQDGDMDFVMSHEADGIDLYESLAINHDLGNYVKLNFTSSTKNPKAIGTQVRAYFGPHIRYDIQSPYRGYLSTNEAVIHIGLGEYKKLDSIEVINPMGKTKWFYNLAANKSHTIDVDDFNKEFNSSDISKAYLSTVDPGINIKHTENTFDDYDREILIPYKMSSLGPVFATSDVNGDGDSDFYFGGSKGKKGILVFSDGNGGFNLANKEAFSGDEKYEDGCASFMDLDKDGDLDLYVCSGGNENEGNNLQDRIYLNFGTSGFKKAQDFKLPSISSNTIAYNDEYLFIGGRQKPGQYGKSVSSYLYNIKDGALKDLTETQASWLTDLGMVTDASWADLDGDGKAELIMCGEWMPITIAKWEGEQLKNVTSDYGLEKSNGLWNCLKIMDLDNDNDLDIIAGNQGLNNKYKASYEEPFTLFADDFDKNGSHDVYLGSFDNSGTCYPVRGRQCSSEQMPFVSDKFKNYHEFALAPITEVLDGKITEKTTQKNVYTFASSMFYFDAGKFEQVAIDNYGQFAPVHDILPINLDQDPEEEIYLVGNFYDREVETTRSDAGVGVVLDKVSEGYKCIAPDRLGALANKDARHAKAMKINGKTLIAIANNNDAMQFFRPSNRS